MQNLFLSGKQRRGNEVSLHPESTQLKKKWKVNVLNILFQIYSVGSFSYKNN